MPSIAQLIGEELHRELNQENVHYALNAAWIAFPVSREICLIYKDRSFLLISRKGYNAGDLPDEAFNELLIDVINILGRRAIEALAKSELETLKEEQK